MVATTTRKMLKKREFKTVNDTW